MASEPPPPKTPGLMELLSLGAYSGFCVAIGVLVGWLADRAFGTSPTLTAVGLLLGVVGAGFGTVRLMRRMLGR